jgi:hypothetical protein
MDYDEEKFKEFNKMLGTDAWVVIIHHPQVLGDDYGELIENLNRLADCGKSLAIIPRKER